jgi:hypothetical protein
MQARVGLAMLVATALVVRTLWLGRRAAFRKQILEPPAHIVWLCCLNLYVCGYVVILMLFLSSGPGSWYLALSLTVTMVTMAYVLDRAGHGYRRLQSGVLRYWVLAPLLLICVLSAAFVFKKIYLAPQSGSVELGLWMKASLPSDARIFQVDSSGRVAYFSERSVINGDGLINGWEYQRALRSGNLAGYLRSNRVEYVIWDAYEPDAMPQIDVPLWTQPAIHYTFSEAPETLAAYGRLSLLRLDPDRLVLRSDL